MPLSPAAIERQLISFIETNFGPYLAAQAAAEAADLPERFPLPEPAAVVAFNAERRFAEQDLPAIVIELPQQLRGRRGMTRGTWDAEVPIQVGVLTSASDGSYARANAGTYLAALTWLFTTQQSLGGLTQGVELVSVGLSEPFGVGQSRFMAAGELLVQLLVRGIADRSTRPGVIDPVPADNGLDLTIAVDQP